MNSSRIFQVIGMMVFLAYVASVVAFGQVKSKPAQGKEHRHIQCAYLPMRDYAAYRPHFLETPPSGAKSLAVR